MLSNALRLLRAPRHLKLPTNESLQFRFKLVRPPSELLLSILLARLDRTFQLSLRVYRRPFDLQHHRAHPTVILVRRQLEPAASSHPRLPEVPRIEMTFSTWPYISSTALLSSIKSARNSSWWLRNCCSSTMLCNSSSHVFFHIGIIVLMWFRLSSSVLTFMRPSFIERNT
ncbi:hypothetical protein DFH94DRAFT_140958 [Russula ochroleuca]|uniref:Uncharacterized protein n=1 Tax=Russula ochroleuca TaxID=152965 RepID=A0A9P5MR50_9AGAM|nr:hypothetical protein DFH94DRAFT_140958 [Russula ochroleuca]